MEKQVQELLAHLELIQELHIAAQLRKDSAAADEQIAQLYERIAEDNARTFNTLRSME